MCVCKLFIKQLFKNIFKMLIIMKKPAPNHAYEVNISFQFIIDYSENQ